jgi:hypothetical protein
VEVLSLQIFVSLVLVLVSILLFAHAAKGKDHEQADRLALLPLASDQDAATTCQQAKEPDGAQADRDHR